MIFPLCLIIGLFISILKLLYDTQHSNYCSKIQIFPVIVPTFERCSQQPFCDLSINRTVIRPNTIYAFNSRLQYILLQTCDFGNINDSNCRSPIPETTYFNAWNPMIHIYIYIYCNTRIPTQIVTVVVDVIVIIFIISPNEPQPTTRCSVYKLSRQIILLDIFLVCNLFG